MHLATSAAKDSRIVLTLDAGGTKFAFSAVRGGEILGSPVTFPSHGDDLDACLDTLLEGFERVHQGVGRTASAISFAFPGPADYPAGIIGDLVNLPAFRGGVALGPLLEERFGLPVFINNDGDLFAYGEALGGLLPWANGELRACGSPKRFRNLFGATFGTGFGAGLVHDGRLYLGDNAAASEIWPLPNVLDRDLSAEEGVSVRGVRRAYARAAGAALEEAPDPEAMGRIAEGTMPGNREAAREAFRRLGRVAGHALACAVTLTDGLVVIGGGLSGSASLFMPALVAEMNRAPGVPDGEEAPSREVRAFNLEDARERAAFFSGPTRTIPVPRSNRRVTYDPIKRTGVGVSRLGTQGAVALGAYAYALHALDGHKERP